MIGRNDFIFAQAVEGSNLVAIAISEIEVLQELPCDTCDKRVVTVLKTKSGQEYALEGAIRDLTPFSRWEGLQPALPGPESVT